MKRQLSTAFVLLLTLGIAGCRLIADIFEVGFWLGVVLVLVIIVVIWVIYQMFD